MGTCKYYRCLIIIRTNSCYITCSSNQISNPETTNSDYFFFRSAQNGFLFENQNIQKMLTFLSKKPIIFHEKNTITNSIFRVCRIRIGGFGLMSKLLIFFFDRELLCFPRGPRNSFCFAFFGGVGVQATASVAKELTKQ